MSWGNLTKGKVNKTRIMWIFIFLIGIVCANKSRYIPSGDEDTVDNQDGQIEVASFSIDTEYLVIGGIFSITNNGTKLPNSSGVQRTIAFECAIAAANSQGGITTYYYNIQVSNY